MCPLNSSGKSLRYEHLKVFGCLCFVSTLNKGRHKSHRRAQKCVFIGLLTRKDTKFIIWKLTQSLLAKMWFSRKNPSLIITPLIRTTR